MTEHIYHQYGLATPTDWNAECELLKEYLSAAIYATPFLNIDIPTDHLKSPEEIMKLYMDQGLIFIGNDYFEPQPPSKLSFEEWKEIKKSNQKEGPIVGSDEYRFCNHHHEFTEDYEIVDYGTGRFVANKAAIPLLESIHNVGMRTRTHHYDGGDHGFISILLDNVDVEIVTVNEIHANRTQFNGKKELLIRWDKKKNLNSFFGTDDYSKIIKLLE